MTNIVALPDPETMILTPEEVAEMVAGSANWQSLLVIGFDAEGDFQAQASRLTTGEALMLIEAAKMWLLRDLKESMDS